MGRANRFLSPRVNLDRLRLSGPEGRRSGQDPRDRQSRSAIGHRRRRDPLSRARRTAPEPSGDRRLAGARVMADVVPAALALLNPDERQWIRLTQQARGEDSARVAAACARMELSGRDRGILRRFAGADRRPRISSSAAPALRPSPSSRSSGGLPSWCRFPTRSIRIRRRTRRRSRRPAARSSCRRPSSRPSVWRQSCATRSPRRRSSQAAAVAAKSVGVPDAAERLADLVLEIARPA